MDTCVYKKQHSDSFQGKTHVTYCGKPAVCIDSNGRELCQSHYNRFMAKEARRKVRKQLEVDKIPYGTFLRSLTPAHEHYELFKHKLR